MELTDTYPDVWPQRERVVPNIEVDSTDTALAKRSGGGDMQAFEEIYKRHCRRVYSICLRMCAKAEEAEDLTQDVFIQLYRKIGSFRGESAFTTWLHRLTVNLVLMHFRKRSVRDEKTIETGEMPEQVVLGTDEAGRMPVQERIDLDRALRHLPRGYLSVFVLYEIEGYEHEEIARLLKIAVGTSKSQLHKARLKMRRILLGEKLLKA